MNYYIPVMVGPVDCEGSYRPEFGRSKSACCSRSAAISPSFIMHHACIMGDGSLASFIAGIETSTACSRSLAVSLISALSSDTVLVNMVAIASAHALAYRDDRAHSVASEFRTRSLGPDEIS